jgi:Protein of unknown function (DUF3396)
MIQTGRSGSRCAPNKTAAAIDVRQEMPVTPDDLGAQFTLNVSGASIFTIGVELIVVSTARLDEARLGYAALYEEIVQRFGAAFRLWQTNDIDYMSEITPEGYDELRARLADAGADGEGTFGVHLQAGATEIDSSPPSFDFSYIGFDSTRQRSGVRVAFPVSSVLSEPDDAVRFVQGAVSEIPFSYGFCGYSLCWNPEFSEVADRFRDWAWPRLKRHPGLSLGDYLPYVIHGGRGLLGVSWLTLLGAEYTAALEGIRKLASRCSAPLTVYELRGGATMIRTGLSPELGDVNREDLLPSYQQVARIVDRLRVPDEVVEEINLGVITGEEKTQWLLRFFSNQDT